VSAVKPGGLVLSQATGLSSLRLQVATAGKIRLHAQPKLGHSTDHTRLFLL